MAVRRQAYEWRNVVAANPDRPTQGSLEGAKTYCLGYPVLDCNPYVTPIANWGNPPGSVPPTPPDNQYNNNINDNIIIPVIPGGQPVGLFTGQFGNNIKTSAQVLDNQMIIIDFLSVWPPPANLNIFVDENYYYDAPDYSALNGLSGFTVPFPEPNFANLFTVESFKHGIDPPIYVLPGSTWGVFWSGPDEVSTNDAGPGYPIGSQVYATGESRENGYPYDPTVDMSYPVGNVRNRLPSWVGQAIGEDPAGWNTETNSPQNPILFKDYQIARAFVKYLLIDGADFLIAKKMLDIGIPVTEKNLQEFKQDLTRWQLRADIHEGDLDEELIQATGMTTRRSSLP